MKLKLKATLADDEIENIKDISVSVDGSWQRCGYSSHNGVVTAMLIDTGKFGRKASIVIFEHLKMIPGKYTVEGFSKVNDKRVRWSIYRNEGKTKKR